MATLLDKLRGRDPDREEKIKRDSKNFTKGQGLEDLPEEEGIEELTPDEALDVGFTKELSKKGYQFGMTPGAPNKEGSKLVNKMAEAGAPAKVAQVETLTLEELTKRLKPKQVASAQQTARMGQPVKFFKPNGELLGEIGPHSPLHKELAAGGKEAIDVAEKAAPTLDYSFSQAVEEAAPRSPKAPRISGEALKYYQETGIDPTRKSGVEALAELRKKKAAEEAGVINKLRNRD